MVLSYSDALTVVVSSVSLCDPEPFAVGSGPLGAAAYGLLRLGLLHWF